MIGRGKLAWKVYCIVTLYGHANLWEKCKPFFDFEHLALKR